MKLWNKLKSAARGTVDGWKGAGYDFKRWATMGGRFFGIENRSLATNETIFAAVSRLSNSMAVLPLKVYKDHRASVDHHIGDLLANSPNSNQTSFDFIRLLETFRNTKGNGYAIKIPGLYNQIDQLVIVDPDAVSPVIEDNSGELWYEVNGVNGRYYVHHMDMIHVKHIHTSGWAGISPIDVLKNTIDYDGQVRQFSMDQMEGAKESFILSYGTNLSEEKRELVIEDFRRFYAENGGILFKEPGVDIDPIEKEFIQPVIFEVEKITRSRVALVYNLPPHMLGVTDGVSYSSMEQSSLDFVQNTLMPIVRMYEQEFAKKLLTPEERKDGYYFKFNVAAIIRGDIKTRGEFYQKGIRNSWFSTNDIREYEDKPPVPGGDTFFISKDLIPLEEAVKMKLNDEQQKTDPKQRTQSG